MAARERGRREGSIQLGGREECAGPGVLPGALCEGLSGPLAKRCTSMRRKGCTMAVRPGPVSLQDNADAHGFQSYSVHCKRAALHAMGVSSRAGHRQTTVTSAPGLSGCGPCSAGKDILWYTREKKDDQEQQLRDELQAIKDREEDLMLEVGTLRPVASATREWDEADSASLRGEGQDEGMDPPCQLRVKDAAASVAE